MNPALIKLLLLQARGFARRIVRGAGTPRRALFLIIGIAVIILWLGPALFTSIAVRHSHPQRRDLSPQRFRDVAPMVLLGICVLTIVSSAGDKAIAFTPGEVDILFPGPFTRRQLLGYRLTKSTLAALLTSLLLSVAMLPYARSWPACYAGIFLTLLLIQLFSTAGVLLGQTLTQRAYSLFRKAVLAGVLILTFVLVRHWAAENGGMRAFYRLRYSEAGAAVLAPFDPFGRAITASGAGDFAVSAGEAVLIDAGLLALVILLDANYVEAALGASRRRYAQIQRIRGGSLLSSAVKGEVKWRLPRVPWFWGAGPIAWRQATSAARSAKGLLLLLLIIAIGIGPLFASVNQSKDVMRMLAGAIAWLTLLLPGMLKFDFRGDLDYMEGLKSLPLPPGALAAGQLVVPTLILTLAHVLLLTGVAIAAPSYRNVLFVAACLALPFDAMLMATENLIFLLFPSRPAAASPGDFQVLGRQAAQLVMKALAVCIGLGVALIVAIPLYILSGGSFVLLTVLTGAILAAQTCTLIPAVAWAYNRFDPSVDTPA